MTGSHLAKMVAIFELSVVMNVYKKDLMYSNSASKN